MTDLDESTLRRLAWVAAGLAALASLAFAFASPAHVEEGWEYRGFFLTVAIIEMSLAVWLVLRSRQRDAASDDDRRAAHRAALVGIVTATAGVLAYVVTLVTGVQHARHSPETIAASPAPLDILTKVVEVALVAILVRLAMLTASGDEAAAVET